MERKVAGVLFALLLFCTMQGRVPAQIQEPLVSRAPAPVQKPIPGQGYGPCLRPLQGNPVLERFLAENAGPERKGPGPETPLVLPFFDDFSYDGPYPDPGRWQDRTVFVNHGFPLFPPTYGAATFDGLDSRGEIYSHARAGSSFWADTLTSRPLRLDSIFYPEARALSPADSVYLSFYYQPGGGLGDAWSSLRRGTAPAKADALNLEFFNAADSVWEIVWSASGMDMEAFCPFWDSAGLPVQEQHYFRQVMVPIVSPAYFSKQFRFRFRGKTTIDANLRTTGGQWHVDYVYVNANRKMSDPSVPDVAFASVNTSLLREYTQVPYRQFDPAMLRSEMELSLTNLDVQAMACRYGCQIFDPQGREVYSMQYPEGSDFYLYPFSTSGYRTEPDVSRLPAEYRFDEAGLGPETYSVRHTLVSGINHDFSRANDTLAFLQVFGKEFAYDDGTAEAGWGLNYSGGAVAYAFELLRPDSLTGVRVFFNRSFGNANRVPFNLVVWGAGPSDTVPGQELYRMEGLEVELDTGINRFAFYPFGEPVLLPAGRFHIGIEQTSSTFLNIGFDQNADLQGKMVYSYFDPLQHAWVWFPSLYRGALMMRPVFGAVEGLSNQGGEALGQGFRVFPNPVRGESFSVSFPPSLRGTDVRAELFDMKGNKLWERPCGERFPAGGLASGVYLLRFSAEGKVSGFSKVVVLR